MHEVSDLFDAEISRADHKKVWEIDVVPDYDIAQALTGEPTAVNYFTGKKDDVFNAPMESITYFLPNTNRNGDMWLMVVENYYPQKAYLSSQPSNSDGSFTNNLKITFSPEYGEVGQTQTYPYSKIGISFLQDNGDYAKDFTITLHISGAENQVIQVSNNTEPIYHIPAIDGVSEYAYLIDVELTKWSAPYVYASISRIFFGTPPYTITNKDIVSTPNVFKELESDSEMVGSVSANQLSLGFFNSFGFDETCYQKGARIKVRYGIKTDNIFEVVPYGTFYISKGEESKSIVKITALDKLSTVTKSNFFKFCIGDTETTTYGKYIQLIFPQIIMKNANREPFKVVAYPAPGKTYSGFNIKQLRAAPMSELIDEFNLLTGSCIAYSDKEEITLYDKCTEGLVQHEIPDSCVISKLFKARSIPAAIRIYQYALKVTETQGGQSAVTVYQGDLSKVYIPPYSQVADSVVAFNVIFDKLAYEPYTSTSLYPDDVLYASCATLYRRVYEDPYTRLNPDLCVNATSSMEYDKTPTEIYKRFEPGGKELFFNNYIAVGDGCYTNPTQNNYTSIVTKIFEWIRDPIIKTKNEYIFEILSDPRYELGDRVTIKGKTGTIYRLETNGAKMKITIRGDN